MPCNYRPGATVVFDTRNNEIIMCYTSLRAARKSHPNAPPYLMFATIRS